LSAGGSAQHSEFASEQEFLIHAHRCLSEMRNKAADAGDAGGDKKSSAALAEIKKKYLDKLHNPDSILFGRLDFDDGQRHYVGPRPIWDSQQKLVAISWAAPAARPYYEASPADPLGIELRRRFQTERERLLGIADEFFGEAAPAPTLDDLLLNELDRERTAEMQQVAATIKQDQYRIIERPMNVATVVQGGPGTGKTVVGLHRAALLLYRHREQLAGQRVLIVGPNRVFMKYISYVLPSLGETAVDQVVPDSLVELRGSSSEDKLVALVKGDARMASVLRNAIGDRVRAPEADLEFVTETAFRFTVTKEEIGALLDEAKGDDRPFLNARTQFRGAFERAIESAHLRAYAKLYPEAVPTPISARRLREFDRAVDRIWPTLSAAEVVRQLLSSEDRIERASADVLTSTEQKLIHRKPVERIDLVDWTTSDLPLVDEVQALLDGRTRRYGHVVLDEAQDLTPMQLRMVGRRISGSAVTILGDLAQATGLWTYATWEELVSHLSADPLDVELIELIHAYRVPQEIMEVALPVLHLTAPSIEPPRPFRPGGRPPTFLQVGRQDRVGESIRIATAASFEGGTTAIIAPRSLLPEFRAALTASGADFADADEGELGGAIELVDPISSKGLEFDHVVIAEPAAIIRDAEGVGHRELYVALTRATRTLTAVHSEPLPWPLGFANESTVEPSGRHEGRQPPVGVPKAAGGIELSFEEALDIARRREIPLRETLARLLIASRAADTDADLARIVLDVSSIPPSQVEALLGHADRLKRGEAES
jgi:DNA helicase IV